MDWHVLAEASRPLLALRHIRSVGTTCQTDGPTNPAFRDIGALVVDVFEQPRVVLVFLVVRPTRVSSGNDDWEALDHIPLVDNVRQISPQVSIGSAQIVDQVCDIRRKLERVGLHIPNIL